ncbi:MAG: MFS transporter [Eubacterium sp.]
MEKSKKGRALVTVLIITFMVTLDSSIVNVALPEMAKNLGVDMGGIEWVATGYLLVVSATVMLFGKLGDMYGKARIFQIGVVIFTVGSLLCSLSGTLLWLIIFRAFQGLGGAAALANNQGIITETFSLTERGRALSSMSAAVALGLMSGPVIGGVIVSMLSWPFIFLINVPVGTIAFLLGLKNLPYRTVHVKEKLDAKGSLFMIVSIVFIFSAIPLLNKNQNFWTIGMLLLGILLFIFFILEERQAENPLIQLGVFKNKLFSINLFGSFISFVVIGALNIILPFYLQDVMNLSPEMTGLMLTVTPLVIAVVGPISGVLTDRFGYRYLLPISFGWYAFAILLALILNTDTPLWLIAGLLGLGGIGNAAVQPPGNTLLMSGVSNENLGFAGSLAGLMRNIGITTGVMLGTSLLYNRMSAMIGYPVFGYVPGRNDVFVVGMHWVYGTLGALLILVTGLFCYVLLIGDKKKKFIENQEG